MLAQAIGDPSAVAVAWIGALGVITVAFITSVPALVARHASRDLSHKVGDPNGRGNVIELLHQLLDGQARQDERMARQDERIAVLEQGRITNSGAIGQLEGRVHVIEQLQKGAS